jgi:hypothetical protein
MKTKLRPNPPDRLWIIIDMRGTILEKEDLVRTTERNIVPGVPGFSMWKDRESARETIRSIKARMTKAAWNTWKLKAVKYELRKS